MVLNLSITPCPASEDPLSSISSISSMVLGCIVPHIFHGSSTPWILSFCMTTYSVRLATRGPLPSPLSRLCRVFSRTTHCLHQESFMGSGLSLSKRIFVEWKGKIVKRGHFNHWG